MIGWLLIVYSVDIQTVNVINAFVSVLTWILLD